MKNRIVSLIIVIFISMALSSYASIVYTKADNSYTINCMACHENEWIQLYYSLIHSNMTCQNCHIVTTEISPHNITTLECINCHTQVNLTDHNNLIVEGRFTGDNGKCLACHSDMQISATYTKRDVIEITVIYENGDYKVIYN